MADHCTMLHFDTPIDHIRITTPPYFFSHCQLHSERLYGYWWHVKVVLWRLFFGDMPPVKCSSSNLVSKAFRIWLILVPCSILALLLTTSEIPTCFTSPPIASYIVRDYLATDSGHRMSCGDCFMAICHWSSAPALT